MPSAATDTAAGVSGLLLLLFVVELVALRFLNPVVIILSTGDIPVTIGRWFGVVEEDRAMGGETRYGFINRIVSL